MALKNETELLEKDIKIIALDLDGTTFNSSGGISGRTVRAIEDASEKGIYVVISTGRSYASLPDHIKSVRGIDYAITSNGAHVNYLETGEAVFSDFLSSEAVSDVAAIKKATNAEIEVFIDGVAYTDESYYNDVKENGCSYRNADYVIWSRRPVKDAVSLMLENRDRIENVNLIYRTVDMLEESRPEVEKIRKATITSSFPNNLEVGGPNTSKKTALIWLLGKLGLDRENLMSCGDAPNDIAMAEFAGIGVAMENAWGGLKDHADYITASNDDDGVALAIEKFALKR